MANLTTPVSNLGGGGGSSRPVTTEADIIASTITLNPTTSTFGLSVDGNTNNVAGIQWDGPPSLGNPNLFSIQTINNGTNFDILIGANAASYDSGTINFVNINNITLGAPAEYGNLVISTVNGSVLQAGTPSAVTSVNGDSFGTIVANPTTGAVKLNLRAAAGPFPNAGTAVNYFSIQGNYNRLTAGTIAVLTNSPVLVASPLKKGWYSYAINGLHLWLAQTAPTPSTGPIPFQTQALTGDLIEHTLVITNGDLGNTFSQSQSAAVTPNTSLANIVYPQDSYLNLTGTFYISKGAEAGVTPTITLKTYYNAVFNATTTPPSYNGIWSYTLPSSKNQDWITIQPIKSA